MMAPATMTALERLKGAFPAALAHRVAVYVPSTVDRDKPTDNAQEVNALALLLSELAGGYGLPLPGLVDARCGAAGGRVSNGGMG